MVVGWFARLQFARLLLTGPRLFGIATVGLACVWAGTVNGAQRDPEVRRSIERGLEYLASIQARDGRWEADGGAYRCAMTALAGVALLQDGHTTMQGKYSRNVQAAVGFLLDQAQNNGLIGYPDRDMRYMYGHGFSMLFLSQVLGEEENMARRERIVKVLTKAVEFCGQAQTVDGGWGYVSARDGQGFDEGSVTITQMQGLRGCRNAGIPVPKDIVDKGIKYIERCTDSSGGVRYSLKTGGGPRPPITAAAVACMFNAGEYNHPGVNKMIVYSERELSPAGQNRSSFFGHWHYAHYYFAQVVYRLGEEKWRDYSKKTYRVILDQQAPDGSWNQGYIGAVYTTALSLTILQLDSGALPIYQR